MKIQPPAPWGVYHLCCLAVTLALTVLMFVFGKRLRRGGTARAVTLGLGWFLIVIEVIKQLVYGLEVSAEGQVYWDYPWQLFPFQFCSTPMYVCFALMFVRKNGAAYQALCAFLATYGAFGGATVLLHPDAVFTEFLFADIHTMAWHVTLVLLGMVQWAGGTFRFSLSSWLGATSVFAVLVVVALLLNVSLPSLAEECGFNMFYISPYVPCTILFLVQLWRVAPYPVFLAVYVLGFVVISAAIYFAFGYAILFARGGKYPRAVRFRAPKSHLRRVCRAKKRFAVKGEEFAPSCPFDCGIYAGLL